MDRGWGWGGVILSFRSCLAWSVESERSTLTSASIALACEVVWALIQCKSGVTLRSRPKDNDLDEIRFQTFTGVINGDLSSRCTSESGAVVTLATVNVSDVAVASGTHAVPGPVLDRSVSSSATVGVATLRTVIHSALTSTFMGGCPRRTSIANTRTVPSSGMARVNDEVMYCAPQRILMCDSGLSNQIRRKGPLCQWQGHFPLQTIHGKRALPVFQEGEQLREGT